MCDSPVGLLDLPVCRPVTRTLSVQAPTPAIRRPAIAAVS